MSQIIICLLLVISVVGCSTKNDIAKQSSANELTFEKRQTNPLQETQSRIFSKMEKQEMKNDVKCWSSVRNIEEMFFNYELAGDALHQKEKMINRFIFQIWLFAQNAHSKNDLLTAAEIDSSFELLSRFRFLKNADGYQVSFINSSHVYQEPLTVRALDLEDYRRSSSAWRALLAVASQTTPDILFKNLDDSAVARMADLSDIYSIVIAKLGNRYAKMLQAKIIDARILQTIEQRHSPSVVNVYGWLEGKDYVERAYAQSLAYSISKIRSLNFVNGKLPESEVRKQEAKFTNLKLDQQSSEYFRKILSDLALDIWTAAESKTEKNVVFVGGAEIYNTIIEKIPYEVDDLANIIFFPNSQSPVKYQEFESDAFRDDATHWKLIYDLTKEFVQDGSQNSNRKLKALDIYAAEELSELISNYSVPLLRTAGQLAKSQNAKTVTVDHLKKAHLALLQRSQNQSTKEVANGKKSDGPTVTEFSTPVKFTNVTSESGLEKLKDPDKLHEKRMENATLMAFDAFRGIATGDINNDGLTDLFLANEAGTNSVYKNIGQLKFENVTAQTNLPELVASTGGQIIDFDNDGCKDLFVVRVYEPLKLYKGNCDFTFVDVSEKLGKESIIAPSTGAIWFDYDNDGWLDLYILTTGDFKNGFLPSMGDVETATPKIFLRNIKGQKFQNKTAELGLGDKRIGLAAAASDLFNTGKASVYIANDMQPNSLYINDGKKFVNKSKLAMVDDFGNGMGVTVADFNKDGYFDIFLTNVSLWNPRNRYIRPGQGTRIDSTKEKDQFIRSRQTNRLYQNTGNGTFKDVTADLIGAVNMGWGWNGFFFDVDNDANSDLYVVNGFRPESLLHHDEAKVLLRWSEADKRFVDYSMTSGSDVKGNSRGSVFGDFDNDGDQDIIITGLHSPIVLRNDTNDKSANWTGIKLKGMTSNKDGYGARVIVKSKSGVQQLEMGNQGGGFISSINDSLHFGLGKNAGPFSIEVKWPSGKISRLKNPEPNQILTVTE